MATPDTNPAARGRRLAWWLAPGVAFVGLLGVGLARTDAPPVPGDPAPAFEAPLLAAGGTRSLADFEGGPLVLNFWASWCVPCEEEAPFLNRAHRVYGDEIAFLGVDIRDSRSDALAFTERFEVAYPSVEDRGLDLYDAFGLTGQPETFFIDGDGVIVDHVPGAFATEEQLFQRLNVLVSRDG